MMGRDPEGEGEKIMGLRKILTVQEPCLHKVCRPVEKFDGKLHKLLDDMKGSHSWAL